MPFRSIVATPKELARIAAAFEETWSDIAPAGFDDICRESDTSMSLESALIEVVFGVLKAGKAGYG